MSLNKKKIIQALLKTNTNCGCGKPKLSDVYQPKPISSIPKPQINFTSHNNKLYNTADMNYDTSSTTSYCNEGDCATSTTISCNNNTTNNSESEPDPPRLSASRRFRESSVAVVKKSNDPFHDFKHSMLQMIFEKEMSSKEELQELLQCLLELNERCHHDVIVKAFIEIWNDMFVSKKYGFGGGDI